MSRKETISVAMAAYNGMAYIQEQIDSILIQLEENDELVISCDPSSDGTWEYLEKLATQDSKIKIFKGLGKGVIKNFENTLSRCQNSYIFLCDQDDVWMPDKADKVLNEFRKSGADLVLHDAKITDGELNVIQPSFFAVRKCQKGFLHNIIKNSYIGCCMAFKRELLEAALPFPEQIPMHDQWIGLLGSCLFSESFLEEPLLLYRRHGGNVSSDKHAGMIQMISWRLNLLFHLRKRVALCKKKR